MQKYRKTADVFAPFFGAQLSTFKKRTLGPRSVGPQTIGPQDRWAPDRCRSPTSDMIFVKYLHISDKYEKLPKIIISRQFQHPEKFEQISLFM